MLNVTEYRRTLLVHTLIPSGPIPTAQDPDGVYPYESFCETSRRPQPRELRFIRLENDKLIVEICPDFGGKVFSIFHKASKRDVMYAPEVVRPVRILPRGFYIPGGIEVSFPISHSPVQAVPVLARTARIDGRAYAWCGERELRFGMHWTVEFSLGEADAFLSQRTVFYNPTSQPRPWMSWSNACMLADPDVEISFPNGPVLYHGGEMKTIDWEKEGPRRQADIDRMAGYFWRDPDCCAFGVYNPGRGVGLYHVADPKLTPGIKFWTYGIGRHKPWSAASSPAGDQYLEIQGGPLVDQSIKDQLQPGQTRWHQEFWYPTDSRMDIHAMAVPEAKLVGLDVVPSFAFARRDDVAIWESLAKAHADQNTGAIPEPPSLIDNHWAPSGMQIDEAIMWAAQLANGDRRGRWLFQLGAWLAGCDRIDEALNVLNQSSDDRARALAGRLYRRNKEDFAAAAEAFRSIREPAIALHPQVMVERDLALAGLGKQTLAERDEWFDKIAALDDEWVRERLAYLRFDQGRHAEAKEVLRATAFQLVHQRYARTRLWRAIEKALGEPPLADIAFLGEDDLAQFGAYREYGED
ncbi:DUF5107 domain-containing protein [bacterium]|nr:DUF5107 domain-containing protein [bacterium]